MLNEQAKQDPFWLLLLYNISASSFEHTHEYISYGTMNTPTAI